MPVVPPAVGNPYPTVGAVMNLARVRVNDTLNDIDGDLLTSDAPYAQTMLSAAWRWYQDKCSTVGVETLVRVAVLQGVPVQFTQDTADQAYITWLGCSDGVNQYDSPALPQDLIQPLSIRTRQSGTTNNFSEPMRLATDGLPSFFDYNVYDWRDDGLYFYASLNAQDFQIRYSAYRANLDVTNPTQQIPMMRCEDCLSARVGYEFVNARKPGGAGAASLSSWAERAFSEGAGSRTSRRKQRANIRRIPYSGRRYCVPYPIIH